MQSTIIEIKFIFIESFIMSDGHSHRCKTMMMLLAVKCGHCEQWLKTKGDTCCTKNIIQAS